MTEIFRREVYHPHSHARRKISVVRERERADGRKRVRKDISSLSPLRTHARTERKIGKKTHNLTRDRDQNDRINYWIQGFSFCDFEDNHRHLRGKFSLFYRRNLISNHSIDVETSLEVIRSKRFKDANV